MNVPNVVYWWNGVFALLTLIFVIILRFRRGSSISLGSTIVAAIAFNHFGLTSTVHSYYLWGSSFSKNDTLNAPADSSDIFATYKYHVAQVFRFTADELDGRIYLPEYESQVRVFFGYSMGLIGSILYFLTFTGHLFQANCVYVTQTISAVWSAATFFFWNMPAFLNNDSFYYNKQFYYIGAMPLVLYVFFAIGGAYSRFSKCSGAKVCSFTPVSVSKPAQQIQGTSKPAQQQQPPQSTKKAKKN